MTCQMYLSVPQSALGGSKIAVQKARAHRLLAIEKTTALVFWNYTPLQVLYYLDHSLGRVESSAKDGPATYRS